MVRKSAEVRAHVKAVPEAGLGAQGAPAGPRGVQAGCYVDLRYSYGELVSLLSTFTSYNAAVGRTLHG